jgi:hypothetical protein
MTNTINRLLAVAVMVGAGVALASCEAGSYFDPNTAALRNDKVGRLEATGEDLRVYEFTPQTSPNMQCVFVAGEKKGGLQCWEKAGK